MNNFLTNEAFKQAKPIVEQLVNKKYEAYYVGGCIRDFLLKRQIHDIDITTSALPEDIQDIFTSVIPVGIEHGTVIVRFRNQSYEVTTFRTTKNKRRNQPLSLKDDLKLRDFTMNAVAMDINGHIYDYFQGVKDIQNKKIRLVADDEKRLTDDPLRILRAFRFAAQLNFIITDDTFSKLVKNVPLINMIKIERLHNEWFKLITAKHFTKIMSRMMKSSLISYLPIFKDYPELNNTFENTREPFHSFAHFIAYMHFLKPKVSVHTWCKHWNVAKHEKNVAIKLVELLMYTKSQHIDAYVIYQLPEELTATFSSLVQNTLNEKKLDIFEMNKIRQSLPIQGRNDLQLNGNDLVNLFPNLSKGPWIKELLQKVEKQVVLSTLKNEFNAIKEWVLCNPPNQK